MGELQIDDAVLRKLFLARRLYQLARDHVASSSDVELTIACNLLQDSVEYFLLALAGHVGAEVKDRTAFDGLIDLTNC